MSEDAYVSDVEAVMAEDKAFVKAIIAAFYDDALANRIGVNEDVVLVLAEMLDQASDCTEWLSCVPKPVSPIGVKPGLKWALKQIRRIGQQLIRDPSSKVAFECKKAVSYGYRQRLELASAGAL